MVSFICGRCLNPAGSSHWYLHKFLSVVERVNVPAPVVERVNVPAPVVERVNVPAPVVERVNVPAPVCPRLLREEKRRARILISIGLAPVGPREYVTTGRLGGSYSLGAPPRRAQWKRESPTALQFERTCLNTNGLVLRFIRFLATAGTLTRSTMGRCGNVDTFHYGAMRER